MDVKYINPFIISVANTMQTMLGVEVQQLPPVISNGGCRHGVDPKQSRERREEDHDRNEDLDQGHALPAFSLASS